MKFIKHSVDCGLLLKQSVIAKQSGGMKTRYRAGEFLNDGLMNRLFLISKDEGIAMRHLLRRGHHALKPFKRLVEPVQGLIVKSSHRGKRNNSIMLRFRQNIAYSQPLP